MSRFSARTKAISTVLLLAGLLAPVTVLTQPAATAPTDAAARSGSWWSGALNSFGIRRRGFDCERG